MRSLIKRLIRSLKDVRDKQEAETPPVIHPSDAKKYESVVVTRNMWNPQRMLEVLTPGKPFFKMNTGVYGLALNQYGKAAGFIRVDKDRTPHKLRKRARRTARELARATA